jgi:hypothetical protein
MLKKISRVQLGLASMAGIFALSLGIAGAASISVTNQIRTDFASAGSDTETNSAPDNGTFNDTTTATSTNTLTTTTASQTSSFGVSGSNFVANVTLGASENIGDNSANNGRPSFELDFNASAASAYTFNGSTNLMFNGMADPTGFYTGMNLQLLEGATSIFSVNPSEVLPLTSDPQTIAFTGTLSPGDYVLKMSLDSGGAGGMIQGSLDGTLTMDNGSSGSSGSGGGSAVPVPAAVATVPVMLVALGLVKLGAGVWRKRSDLV